MRSRDAGQVLQGVQGSRGAEGQAVQTVKGCRGLRGAESQGVQDYMG